MIAVVKKWLEGDKMILEYLMCEYLEGKKSFEEVFKEFNDWITQEIEKELEKSKELIEHGCRRKN